MPANLTAEAKAKWGKAISARNPQEKIQALQEFLSSFPKHKGNERLRAQVKRKIATLRVQLEEMKIRKGGSSRQLLIEKQGVAQIVILGVTNVGKSSLLSAVTAAKPLIAPYEYTTQEPVQGMLQFEDVQFQLIEVPAIRPELSSRLNFENVGLQLNADALMLVVDLSRDSCAQLSILLDFLDKARISLERPKSSVEILRDKSASGIQIALSGKLTDCTAQDAAKLLQQYGIRNALVRVYGNVGIDDLEDAILESTASFKPSILIANKVDAEDANIELERLKTCNVERMQILATSCKTGQGLAELGASLFEILEIVRIYTKEPSQREPSEDAIVLRRGATVAELARQIHSDLLRNFKYARIWGPSARFNGEKVGINHILMDRDVVEIHAR